jgi:peroxiredoxin
MSGLRSALAIPFFIRIAPRALCRSSALKLLLCLFVGTSAAQTPKAVTSLLHKEAPEFVRIDLENRKLDLRAYKGKVVLLDFWATWCGPCRLEMPDLNDFYSRFKAQGLVVLSITNEESLKVSNFVSETGYRAPVLLDSESQAAKRFHVENLPRSFVFNRKGKLVALAVDQRSRRQFIQMLAAAGIHP